MISAAEAGGSLHQNGVSGSEEVAVIAGIIVGTVIAASTMAFFGYVLQFLTSIYFDTRYREAFDRSYPGLREGTRTH